MIENVSYFQDQGHNLWDPMQGALCKEDMKNFQVGTAEHYIRWGPPGSMWDCSPGCYFLWLPLECE